MRPRNDSIQSIMGRLRRPPADDLPSSWLSRQTAPGS
jgi:hypothetical protein